MILARRETRNSRTSLRLSTDLEGTSRAGRPWGALPVHLSTGTPTTRAGSDVDWVSHRNEFPDRRSITMRGRSHARPPATSASSTVTTRRSSSRPTRSSARRRPASAGRTCGPTGAPSRLEPRRADGPRVRRHRRGGRQPTSPRSSPGQFVVGSFFASDNTCEICRAGYQTACVHRRADGRRSAPRPSTPASRSPTAPSSPPPTSRPPI